MTIQDKEKLNFMPEDCVQFLDIETNKFNDFLNTWDECIKNQVWKVFFKLF